MYWDPTKRDKTNGLPNISLDLPNYPLDYGIKNGLINIPTKYGAGTIEFTSKFDSATINDLTVSNVTQYQAQSEEPLIIKIDSTIKDITINNLVINDVDIMLNTVGAILVSNYGAFTLENSTISNINKKAYEFDNENFSYVSVNGAVLHFKHVTSDRDYDDTTYAITNVIFDHVYAKKGGAIYLDKDIDSSEYHSISLKVNTITITNSYSYTYGMIAAEYGKYQVVIGYSKFENNQGINGEADIRIMRASSVHIGYTNFTLFSSTLGTEGASITVVMDYPLAFNVVLISVNVICTNTHEEFLNLLENADTKLTKSSPIYLSSGQLVSYTSLFSKCIEARSGGVINIGSQSVSLFNHIS